MEKSVLILIIKCYIEMMENKQKNQVKSQSKNIPSTKFTMSAVFGILSLIVSNIFFVSSIFSILIGELQITDIKSSLVSTFVLNTGMFFYIMGSIFLLIGQIWKQHKILAGLSALTQVMSILPSVITLLLIFLLSLNLSYIDIFVLILFIGIPLVLALACVRPFLPKEEII